MAAVSELWVIVLGWCFSPSLTSCCPRGGARVRSGWWHIPGLPAGQRSTRLRYLGLWDCVQVYAEGCERRCCDRQDTKVASKPLSLLQGTLSCRWLPCSLYSAIFLCSSLLPYCWRQERDRWTLCLVQHSVFLLGVLLHITVVLFPPESSKSALILGRGWRCGHAGKLQCDLLGRDRELVPAGPSLQ